MTDDSLICLQGLALKFTRDPLDTHTHMHYECTPGSGVGRLLINGSRSFAPSCRSHRAEGRSCTTREIISAKLCGVGFFVFFTAYLDVCIFAHNLYLCEGWRRCTTLLWVATRSWSHCCWRRRQQWILKTTKVHKHVCDVLKTHCYRERKHNCSQETIASKQEKKTRVLISSVVVGHNINLSLEHNKKCRCVCWFSCVLN